MKRKRSLVGTVAFAVTAALLSPAPPAAASHQQLTIRVGGNLSGAPAQTMRFLAPGTISVHAGDTLTFDMREFHTATFLPAGVGADDWIHDNAHGGGSYATAVPDPDDGPNAWKDNFSRLADPTDANCGESTEPACNYTGAQVLNSGVPFEVGDTFSATVNAAAGSTFWVVCLIHHNMRLRVKVVSGASDATTQSVIDQARTSQLARDVDWAKATHTKYSAKQTFRRTPSGVRIWDAWAGVDSRFVSLQAFYPKRLVIEKGDKVRWRFDSLVMEDHTVSLPDPAIFTKLQFDQQMCDPDGDAGAGPDTAPTGFPEQCPQGSVLETDVSHRFWGGTGDGVQKGRSDVEHSGIRGAQAATLDPPTAGDGSYDVKFNFATGDKDLRYFCFLHPMEAKIKVQS